ncbi:MAG: response regulator [Chlorobia bacterium]|nr:response regulator [Fimbriimonadaceae bacterium]
MSKILIIDDEANLRTMMRLALEHTGYEVDTAEDGPSGLEKYGDGSGFDLVLLDQRMPGMHGIEVQRDIRKKNPKARVILTTAYGTVDIADRAMESGASDFLRKPFTADTLRLAVKSALTCEGDKPLKHSTGFERTTINGYRIELLTEIHDRHFGEVICTYKVLQPQGGSASVKVVVPQYIMELVKAHADTETVPCQNRFWQAMSEEALVNYLWQEAKLPPDNVLRVEQLTPALERWVDGIMTIKPEGSNG